jgi:hypothetical protein
LITESSGQRRNPKIRGNAADSRVLALVAEREQLLDVFPALGLQGLRLHDFDAASVLIHRMVRLPILFPKCQRTQALFTIRRLEIPPAPARKIGPCGLLCTSRTLLLMRIAEQVTSSKVASRMTQLPFLAPG